MGRFKKRCGRSGREECRTQIRGGGWGVVRLWRSENKQTRSTRKSNPRTKYGWEESAARYPNIMCRSRRQGPRGGQKINRHTHLSNTHTHTLALSSLSLQWCQWLEDEPLCLMWFFKKHQWTAAVALLYARCCITLEKRKQTTKKLKNFF